MSIILAIYPEKCNNREVLLTTHILVGGAIGQAAGNLPLAFTGGFLSHLVLDKIPHFDPGIWHKPGRDYQWGRREWLIIILDITLALALLILLIPHSFEPSFIAGALGGAAMDLIDNVPWWQKSIQQTKFGTKINWLHNWSHFQKNLFVVRHKWLMLVLQLLLIAALFCYIKA